MRAIWSEAPPAPAATTISTGLVGSHAAAGPAASASANAVPAARQVFFVIVSSLSSVGASPQVRPSARCCSALCRFTPTVQGHREPWCRPRRFAARDERTKRSLWTDAGLGRDVPPFCDVVADALRDRLRRASLRRHPLRNEG